MRREWVEGGFGSNEGRVLAGIRSAQDACMDDMDL